MFRFIVVTVMVAGLSLAAIGCESQSKITTESHTSQDIETSSNALFELLEEKEVSDRRSRDREAGNGADRKKA